MVRAVNAQSSVQLQKAPSVTAMASHAGLECRPELACPVLERVEILGKRWSLQILKLLYRGDQSFAQLERGLNGIAPGMLSKRLKELEQAKLISRHVRSTRPIAVSYHLADGLMREFACWTKH